jgi:hypothetical protein
MAGNRIDVAINLYQAAHFHTRSYPFVASRVESLRSERCRDPPIRLTVHIGIWCARGVLGRHGTAGTRRTHSTTLRQARGRNSVNGSFGAMWTV